LDHRKALYKIKRAVAYQAENGQDAADGADDNKCDGHTRALLSPVRSRESDRAAIGSITRMEWTAQVWNLAATAALGDEEMVIGPPSTGTIATR